MKKYRKNIEWTPETDDSTSPLQVDETNKTMASTLSLNLQNQLGEAINTIKQSGKEVLITYRKNDTYDPSIEALEKLLVIEKIPYRLEAFERGTEKEKIKQWTKDHEELYTDKAYLTDYTSSSYAYDRKDKNETSVTLILDNHYNNVMKEYTINVLNIPLIKKKSGEYEKEDITGAEIVANSKNIFQRLIASALQKETPQGIIIIKDTLNNHGGRSFFLGVKSEDYREKARDESKRDMYNRELNDAIAETLKESVLSTGYQGPVSIIEEKDSNPYDVTGNRLIRDRHSFFVSQGNIDPKNATNICLPLDTMLSSLSKTGLINESPSVEYIMNSLVVALGEELKKKMGK